MNFFYKKNATVKNPLRILFLCGSHFIKEKVKVEINGNTQEILDKRLVFKNHIDAIVGNKNIKSIILEENFMFSNSDNYLNYNDINLKSLKSIELLTCMYSEKVFVIHESFSTAAEIGMFSSSPIINGKLVILSPDIFTVDEEYISGFMKLSYQNERYDAHNIEIIRYFPGVYKYFITQDQFKLHTFFINNTIPKNISSRINGILNIYKSESYLFGSNKKIHKNNYHVDDKKIKVNLDSKDLIGYLLALFNNTKIKEAFKEPINITELKDKSPSIRKRRLFTVKKDLLLNNLRLALINTLKTEMLNVSDDAKMEINVTSVAKDISINESISYFLYILFALGYITFKEDYTKFGFKSTFPELYLEYAVLLEESTKSKIWGE